MSFDESSGLTVEWSVYLCLRYVVVVVAFALTRTIKCMVTGPGFYPLRHHME